MDIEIAKEKLKVIDIKFFLNGMIEQSNYIVDKADEINIAIETVLSELEKKDRIIKEMAKFIAGLDIDELICKDREHCTGGYEYETCEECIKEYFTKKAEGK